MLNTIEFSLPPDLKTAFEDLISAWRTEDKITRIWERDPSVWTGQDEDRWLGWLGITAEELAEIEKYQLYQTDIASAGFRDVLLLGMGGSSLCPEVLATTFGKANFHILDSTVPAQVKSVEEKIDLETTLFIVASKSGSTLEPNCFKQYFYEKIADLVGREKAGEQFVAITDPGSKMEQIAKSDGFRHILYGKPEIGGRFSALSAFGITAAASMGLDIQRLLKSAGDMVDACRGSAPETNAGALLGLILGTCHQHGRDKLTIFASREIHALGAWLEQLIAESTGKNGVSIIPVDREPIQDPEFYADDRVFAYLTVKGSSNFDAEFAGITAAGHPAIKIELGSIDDIGQEFFRWEFATAVAGSVMKLNPFDQPDVEAAKIEARKITAEFENTGSLPAEKPIFAEDGISLFTGSAYAETLADSVTGDLGSQVALANYLDAHLRNVGDDDYFALLAYVDMNEENTAILDAIRASILKRTGVATCLGFGPRFLHSTGQAYKGGANNGVFLQITSDDAFDLGVPDQKYTFGVVKAAQALGDFQVLLDRGRRALRVHISADVRTDLARLAAMIRHT